MAKDEFAKFVIMLMRILTLLTIVLAAATTDAAAGMVIDVLDGRVGCVQWRHGEEAATVAVTRAGKDDELRLTFDLLDAMDAEESAIPFLQCRLRHLNADHESDGLAESEYLDGFNIADIGYGEASEPGLTTVAYRHYSVNVPPKEMKARLSGNYVLEVFEADKPEKMLIAAAFAIEEGTAEVTGTVTSRTDNDWNGESQQLEIEVTNRSLDRRVSMQELRVEMLQNGDEWSRRRLKHPSQIIGNKALFSHQPELTYKGGNEYRRMETVSVKTSGMNVGEIAWDHNVYHEILNVDTPRRGKPYSYDQTQGGEFTVREADEARDVPSDTEADYTVVHFTLADQSIRPPDRVLVNGALTGRRLDEAAAMDYDSDSGVWRKALLLKQGAYDYRYIKLADGDGQPSQSAIEGDHHQTQNVYTVMVYYRIPGERTDRLAGTTTIKAEANR